MIFDELQRAIIAKQNPTCVGLDTALEYLPEGMAAGKAIISTTVGAIPEVIGEENGILLEPGDVEGLAEAMLACSGNVDALQKMSAENRRKAEETFWVRRMHERLGAYYKMVGDV